MRDGININTSKYNSAWLERYPKLGHTDYRERVPVLTAKYAQYVNLFWRPENSDILERVGIARHATVSSKLCMLFHSDKLTKKLIRSRVRAAVNAA